MTMTGMMTAQKVNFYGRRKGHALSAEKKTILAHLGDLTHFDTWYKPQSLENMHHWPSRVFLEIGFGFGEHLWHWLDQNPNDHIIGAEVFANGIAHCAQGLLNQSHRVRLFTHPVQELWPLLPHNSLDGIIILFPDPWPKKRHHKRRLVQKSFLDQCAPFLKKGAFLRFASDHPELVAFSLDHLQDHERFVWHAGVHAENAPYPKDWPQWPHDWFASRYCQKARAQGLPCAHSVWHKI